MTTYKKKLIEVAIPLETINEASAREKSIRHGHPSTLHLWWARRPLAACRAVLFAQLVDDPSSDLEKFPTHEAQEAERKRLFGIIQELVQWENSTNEEVLERARAEIRKSCGGELPPIYDPFSGGGSIPLEAQRLGLPAYGSDLNPVAVMIGKAMIEIPPKFKNHEPIHPGGKEQHFYRNAEGLAEDVKYYGEWIRERAWERIGYLYPTVELSKEYGGGKATVIAWIWARTVPSPDPAFANVHVPIASSFLLSTRPGKEAWVVPIVNKYDRTIRYEIKTSGSKAEIEAAKEGTKVGRAAFKCLFSDAPMSGDYIDRQAQAGRMSETLLAIVAEGKSGRAYVSPAQADQVEAIESACELARTKAFSHLSATSRGTWGSNAQGRRYKFRTYKDYFNDRQLVALDVFADLVREARHQIEQDARLGGMAADREPLAAQGSGARAYADALSVYLAFVLDKVVDRHSSIATWDSSPSKLQLRNTFARQGIPMTWDFGEGNLFGNSSGAWAPSVEWVSAAIANFVAAEEGRILQEDAATQRMSDGSVISTDPPYYDNISYADLADFLFPWLKACLHDVYPELFALMATPKVEELVATTSRHGGRKEAEHFFLEGMRAAIKRMADHSLEGFPATIYYAFKQSEITQEGISSTGWATFLQAVIEAGYSVVGTWPIRTEMANRIVASGTNALANSVVLVCRQKKATAEIITRAEFVRALKRELPPAIADLQTANIAPADMPQSAIGPGMGVFSRYKAVLESDDNPMSVKTALQLINRELDEYLGGIQGEFDADTRFAITWFEQNGLKPGDYGTANSIATARGISVDSVKHAGIVESAAGKVRIVSRDELEDGWDPEEDRHLTVWECLQHLVRQHEKDGISHNTAVLLKKIEAKAEAVKDLAYCLYDISANKRKDAKEAKAYNALIADWTELTKAAAAIHDTSGDRQIQLDI